MTYRERCGMSEVAVDPPALADGVTELVCPECSETVHVGGSPAVRYAIHAIPYADGWGSVEPGDWVCAECGHINSSRHGRCWSCGSEETEELDEAPPVSIGATLQSLAESGFFSTCCEDAGEVTTHDAADPEHGVSAYLRSVGGDSD